MDQDEVSVAEQRKRAQRFMTPPSTDPDKKRKNYGSLEAMLKAKGIKYTEQH